jgi:hypothetical protein
MGTDWYDDENDDDGFDDTEYFDRTLDDEDEWECCMPGRCLMHGLHTRHECFDAEWAEQYQKYLEETHG